MPALDVLRDLDLDVADLALWVLKKSGTSVQPTFSGRWVEIGDPLTAALKQTIAAERDQVEEVFEYSLLAQNNEASALSIETDETHAPIIVEATAAETQDRKVTAQKHLRNAAFYVMKVIAQNNTIIHAVTKTNSSWQTKKSGGILAALFTDQGLDLDTSARFELSKSIDFFIVGESVLIKHKGHFESIVNYKQAHQNDFAELQAEVEFTNVFSDLAPLVAYVGTNKIHLRRMSAIRQKGHYRNPDFMANLRAQHGLCSFIDFRTKS